MTVTAISLVVNDFTRLKTLIEWLLNNSIVHFTTSKLLSFGTQNTALISNFTMEANIHKTSLFGEQRSEKILQKIAEVLALAVPGLHSYKGLSLCYIIYAIFIVFLMMTTYAFAFKIQMELQQYKVLGTIIVLRCTCLTILAVSNAVSTISAIFVNRKNVVKLSKILKDVDKCLYEKFGGGNIRDKVFVMVFGGVHLWMLLFLLLEGYTFHDTFGSLATQQSCMKYFHLYILTIYILQICNYSLYIKLRFQCLNNKIREIILVVKKGSPIEDVNESLEKIRLLMKIFDNLCDAIEATSKSYGIQIIFIICLSVLSIIHGLNTCIKYSLHKVVLFKKDNVPLFLFVNLWSSLTFTVSILRIFDVY